VVLRDEAERLHELLMELVRTTGVLQPDRSVGDHAFSLSQGFALHELDSPSPLSQRELAERLRLDKSSVSRLAAELEAAGLLVRERDPGNHRRYRLRLTERGRAAHARMRETFHIRYEDWVEAMTARERSALLEGLPALVRVIRQHFDTHHPRTE
jgi:DNA-binding MarR family transcriptional regulator